MCAFVGQSVLCVAAPEYMSGVVDVCDGVRVQFLNSSARIPRHALSCQCVCVGVWVSSF